MKDRKENVSKIIELENRQSNGYILTANNKYWGIEYYADGYCQDSYGIVDNIEDAHIFKTTEKPKDDNRRASINFISDAVFMPVVSKLVHTIEIFDTNKD